MSEPSPRALKLRLAAAALLPLILLVLPAAPDGAGPRTLLPAVFAISLAFATGRAVLPLLGGVWLGAAMVAYDAGAGLASPFVGVFDVAWKYVFTNSIYDPAAGELQSFSVAVIGFVFALVGMVAIAIRAGGMAGVADRFVVLARSARSTRLATWAMGLTIFFDDYANTLVVGGSMRPLADRMRVSREKLAWIVDSTAAPVAGLSILSTWVAFEISQFSDQLGIIGMDEGAGYAVFIQTLPFRFYCVFTLIFVGVICATSRDFGPMLKAEQRAYRTGAVFRPGSRPMSAASTVDSEPKPGIPHRAHIAVLPILVTLGTILFLFFSRGEVAHATAHQGLAGFDHLRAILEGVGYANVTLLLVASLAGAAVAFLLAVGEKLLTPREAVAASVSGSQAMMMAVSILLLAWAMSAVCADLGTREYMAAFSRFANPMLLPAGLFFAACFVSFATGSSWSTMGILLPIVIELAAATGRAAAEAAGTDPDAAAVVMVIMTIGAVLDGAIFGDHCSPISDTTILSSTAAGSDHMDHVKTQAPYAVTVMAVAVGAGYLPAAAGLPPGVCLMVGAGLLVAIAFGVGKRLDR
ncbi:MAG: Na+/H+ antiporter NhaC family protein [Proteobacteria bacterium]|nr:Na+/H+ antiporter NhaC family protein [Pseudomonadota bacterium]